MHVEFSRKLDCRSLGAGPERHDIEASADERAALAERFGLVAIDRLSARLGVSRSASGRVRLDGRFSADIVQRCVVTLEPVAATIEEEFVTVCAPVADDVEAEVDLPLDDEDWAEPLVEDEIDLGEAVAQHLSLALDPYPRAPGVEFEAPTEDAKHNPFKALVPSIKGGRQV